MRILRQSILGDFEKCCFLGEYKWGKVGSKSRADEEEFTNKYAMVGIVFHELCELLGKKMIEEDLPYVMDSQNSHLMLTEKFNDIPVELFKDEQERANFHISLHEQLDWAYENCLLDKVKPLAVEFEFDKLNIFEGLLPFNGVVDRIIGNLDEKRVFLEDYKTGRVYTKKELESNVQATIYSLAFYSLFGFLPEEFVFYFTKHKKIKRIKITPDFIERGTNRILEIWKRINDGDGEPDCKNTYFCSHFCDCYEECPKFNKKATKSWDSVNTVR
ncbi:MAG: PD-(D/E)XK nuclease family protein [Clostridium sp.]